MGASLLSAKQIHVEGDHDVDPIPCERAQWRDELAEP